MQTQQENPFREMFTLIDSLKIRAEIMHPAVREILDVEGIERDLQIAAVSMKNASERLDKAWELSIHLNGFESENPRDWD